MTARQEYMHRILAGFNPREPGAQERIEQFLTDNGYPGQLLSEFESEPLPKRGAAEALHLCEQVDQDLEAAGVEDGPAGRLAAHIVTNVLNDVVHLLREQHETAARLLADWAAHSNERFFAIDSTIERRCDHCGLVIPPKAAYKVLADGTRICFVERDDQPMCAYLVDEEGEFVGARRSSHKDPAQGGV